MCTCEFLLEHQEYFGLDYRLLVLAMTNEVSLSLIVDSYSQ